MIWRDVQIYIFVALLSHIFWYNFLIDELTKKLNEQGNECYLFVWSSFKHYNKEYLVTNNDNTLHECKSQDKNILQVNNNHFAYI